MKCNAGFVGKQAGTCSEKAETNVVTDDGASKDV